MTRARPSGPGAGLAIGLAVLSVALSASPRVLLAAGSLPATARPFVWSDVLATYVERLGGTALPYFDAFFEYPPIIGYVSGVLIRSTHGPVAYVIGWAVVCAAAAAVIAALLAREAGAGPAVALWSLSPQLLLYGAMNFDVLAVAFLLGAITLSRRGHAKGALAALAVGALAKGFPALAAPAEIARLARDRGIRYAGVGLAVFLGAAAAIAAPSALARHPFMEGVTYVAELANFDSAWGLVLAALRGVGVHAAGEIVALASGAGLILMYAWALWRTRGGDLARTAALGTVAVLLWTRLYSPQYSLWLVPFFALGALPVRAFALLSLADVIVFATVYPLTLVRWGAGDTGATILFAALAVGVVLRHVALVMAWVGTPRRATA